MYLCAQNHDLKRGGTFETAKAGTFHSVTAGTLIPLSPHYKFLTPRFDVKKQTYSICWADLVSLLEDKQIRRLYLREAV